MKPGIRIRKICSLDVYKRQGVDAALRDDLFQRPSALSAQASREDRGGLGLLIVKRMLELHGGGIRLVESVSGARFRFFVPL